MYRWFISLNYIEEALIATLFTYFLTALGSSIVFIFKEIKKDIMYIMLSMASGIMIAASYFSLLSPAIESSNNLSLNTSLIITLGFISGGTLLLATDKVLNKFLNKKDKRILMLISSITIHNIPEGLVVGIAFGSIHYGIDGITIISAIMLALGIGLQNFPEGAAVSIPLLREGLSKRKAFFYGQLSGLVEPLSGIIGAILVMKVRYLLPFFLSFAAGAMIYVATSELIPESQLNKKKRIMSFSTIIGFAIMMFLDIALS